ncbi:MAG: hypothetical protein OIF56_14935 [Cohaesibacter sp.]|nr:hypothetical protein [Cohaesibacter sp.]
MTDTQIKFEDLDFKEPSGAEIIGLLKEVSSVENMTDVEAGALAAAKASGRTKEEILAMHGDDFWAAVKRGNQLFMPPETRPE